MDYMNKKQKGASLLEYSLLASLIAVVCIAAITSMWRNVGYTDALVYAGVVCKKNAGVGSFIWAKEHVKLVKNGYYGSNSGTTPAGVIWYFKCTCTGKCE